MMLLSRRESEERKEVEVSRDVSLDPARLPDGNKLCCPGHLQDKLSLLSLTLSRGVTRYERPVWPATTLNWDKRRREGFYRGRCRQDHEKVLSSVQRSTGRHKSCFSGAPSIASREC